MCSLGHLLNILFTLSCLLITGAGGMNIIVYYVIQCGNDDIYVRSFILCLGKAFEKPVKVLFALTSQLSSKVECIFFSSWIAVNCLNSTRRCRPGNFYLSPWFQAKMLSANNIPRQKYNRKHSMIPCTSWQQVCSCDGFLCIAVTFKLLAKGRDPLVRHWHSNWPSLCRLSPQKFLITDGIKKEEVWNINALKFAFTYKTKHYLFASAFSYSEKKKNEILCAATWALETNGYILHMMQPHSDIQVKRFIVFQESHRILGP